MAPYSHTALERSIDMEDLIATLKKLYNDGMMELADICEMPLEGGMQYNHIPRNRAFVLRSKLLRVDRVLKRLIKLFE